MTGIRPETRSRHDLGAPREPERHVSRTAKRTAWAVAVIALVISAVVFVFDANMWRESIVDWVEKETGRTIAIDGEMHLDIGLKPVLTARDVRLANADWAVAPNMAEVQHLEIGLDLLALVRGHWFIPHLLLRGASVQLEVEPSGRANWELGAGTDGLQWSPQIQSLAIEDSRLSMVDRARGVELDVAVTSGAAGPDGNARSLTLDGKGRFKGQALELTVRGGPLLGLRGSDRPYPLEARIRIGKTLANLAGSVSEPLRPADLNMKFDISGPNAALLTPILQLPMPTTPPYKLAGDLVREGQIWRFKNVSGVVGDSDLAGTISLDMAQQRPLITADLVSGHIDLLDLGPVLGLHPEGIAPAGSDAAVARRVFSDERLHREQIERTDARVTFRGKSVAAPRLPLLRDVELDFELNAGVLRLRPLRFGFTGGAIKLFTSLDANVVPARTELDLRLSQMQLQNILDLIGLKGSATGVLAGRAVLSAEGDTLRSAMATARGQASLIMERGQIARSTLALLDAGFLKALALSLRKREAEPMNIRCLVAQFAIDDGVMTTTTALRDTEETLIMGAGTIDLGKETLALKIQGKAKRPDQADVRAHHARRSDR